MEASSQNLGIPASDTLPLTRSQNIRAYVDSEGNLKFHPPLYLQRYDAVKGILQDQRWKDSLNVIVEFGCAELAMFSRLKDLKDVSKIVMVDIDLSVLEYYACRAAPLNSDYLNPRDNPLKVEVLCGSVAEHDIRTRGADAVVCIELIEHLEEDIVKGLESTIFGFIQPKIAVFTTPNSDFNVLLKGLGNKFRHYDHKFEWSREEFKNWTDKVSMQHPYYDVEISGVGCPPLGQETVGHCSQVAVFIRQKDYIPCDVEGAGEIYHNYRTYNHPVFVDDRTEEQKLINEVQYSVNSLSSWKAYCPEEEDVAYIPLSAVYEGVQRVIPTADLESVKDIVTGEYVNCDIVGKDGVDCVRYNLVPVSGEEYSDSDYDCVVEPLPSHCITTEGVGEEVEEEEEERWGSDSPPLHAEPLDVEYIISLPDLSGARHENETNLLRERHRSLGLMDWPDSGSDSVSDGDSDSDHYWTPKLACDCEKRWNHYAFNPPYEGQSTAPDCSAPNHDTGISSNKEVESGILDDAVENVFITDHTIKGTFDGNEAAENVESSASFSAMNSCSYEDDFRNSGEEPNTDSGIHRGRCKYSMLPKSKELPKSTSVEVLHLDGTSTLKRPVGLECVEFSPSSTVTLCYTGQKHCQSEGGRLPFSPERKSLDGSFVRDVSLDIDRAGDSGYPNSSSLHHDVDVDLTPEQVDDILSENDDHSHQSISDDEGSDSSDRAPAAFRRAILPRRPVPIMFENVENGDLANNNRDGEGNNAVADPGDEREFVALVEEAEMVQLMAAPAAEDVILPINADPYPLWLAELLGIDESNEGKVSSSAAHHCSPMILVELSSSKPSELDDEGLGDDVNNLSSSVDCNPGETRFSERVL